MTGFRTDKGWWKPWVSGATGAALAGLATLPAVAAGNVALPISAMITGARAGYNGHEAFKKRFNIPWMGKGRRKRVVKKRKRGRR